jgi:hypothetical protein
MDTNLIHQMIYDVDGYKVMLDFDLAELYGVPTRVLNQAVRRNIDRFPPDFMFQLNKAQWENLRSQFVISSWGGVRYLPKAFNEHGVTMLASVLRSERAVKMNVAIVRAFIALRKLAMHYEDLAMKIKELETRYDKQFSDIYDVLLALQEDKKLKDDFNNRARIGFKTS